MDLTVINIYVKDRNYNVDTVEGAADLKCWTCDAKNYNECQATGTLEACLPNEVRNKETKNYLNF